MYILRNGTSFQRWGVYLQPGYECSGECLVHKELIPDVNLNEKEERDVKRFEEKKAPRPEPFETKRKDVLEHQGERPGEKVRQL